MTSKQIANPGGLYGLTAQPDPEVVEYVNGSAGTLLAGDVVVVAADLTGVVATTSTTVDDITVLGVVGPKTSPSMATQPSTDTYAVGAVMPVIIRGPARINIAANAVAAAGVLLGQSAAAKVAATNAAPAPGDSIAFSLEAAAAKDANNTIRCYVCKV